MTAKRFKHLRFVLDVDKTGNLRLFDLDNGNKTYAKLDDVVDLLNEVSEENEQLKQFKDNVFDLIDKNIKETKELFEDGKIDLINYNDSMIILIGLKEQLKGDYE